MSTARLPSRLRQNVLVDVVFELRFEAHQGFSDLIPGIARDLFGDVTRVEKTAMAELPHQVREMDPSLKYQPTMRMVWDNVILIVGDHGIGIGYGEKYPGWGVFQQHINQLLSRISDAGLSSMVEKVNRYAFKYMDFIPSEYSKGIDHPYQVNICVGGDDLNNSPLKIQFEKKEDFGTVLFDFSNPAQAHINDKPTQVGALISIDTVRFLQPGLSWNAFREDIHVRIDSIHEKNKEYFFNVLSEEVLERLEPEYE